MTFKNFSLRLFRVGGCHVGERLQQAPQALGRFQHLNAGHPPIACSPAPLTCK
jgi:hypothetical protein